MYEQRRKAGTVVQDLPLCRAGRPILLRGLLDAGGLPEPVPEPSKPLRA